MKKIIAGLALLLSVSLSASAQEYSNTKIKVGEKAPELAYPNPAGEMLKLSEIAKGRYVLLEFWASWCGPCRRSSPDLVALYNKYKDESFEGAKKGFTVVSISLDQNKEAWAAAIAADHLDWPYHLSDLGAWKSKPAEIYGVQYIPQAFLIGPDGKVVNKYNFATLAAEDLDKKVIKKKG
jgi:thiol-disulfide isomerase/thioredoxin